MVSHRNAPFSCLCCPREMGCNMLPTAVSKQDCPHGSCKANGTEEREIPVSDNSLWAPGRLAAAKHSVLCSASADQAPLGLYYFAGEEKRQNKSALVYFCTADPSALLHSWQGLELSLDPPNKSLFMRHGNTPAPSTAFGLDCPGRGYFGHHRWLLHLAEHRDGANKCLTTTLPSHTFRNKL